MSRSAANAVLESSTKTDAEKHRQHQADNLLKSIGYVDVGDGKYEHPGKLVPLDGLPIEEYKRFVSWLEEFREQPGPLGLTADAALSSIGAFTLLLGASIDV